MMINNKLLIFILINLFFVGFINSQKNDERTQLKFGKEISFDSQVNTFLYHGNSKDLLLAGTSDGSFYLYDKSSLELVRNTTFQSSVFKSPYGISAYLEESNGFIFIVLSSNSRGNTLLYKLNLKFETIDIIVIDDIVVPNQPYSLNFDKHSSIITFVGENGIQRYHVDNLKLQSKISPYNEIFKFKANSVSYVDNGDTSNILYVSGKTKTRPYILKYFLNSYPSPGQDDIIKLILPVFEVPSDYSTVGDLINFEKSFSYVASTKPSDLYKINLLSHSYESKVETVFGYYKPTFAISDQKNFAIYISDDKIIAYQIGHNDFGSTIALVDRKIYAIRDKKDHDLNIGITGGIFDRRDNTFYLSTNSSRIQKVEIINQNVDLVSIVDTNGEKNVNVGDHAHGKHKDNKWWRVLFSVIGLVTGIILIAGLISVYIVVRKRHLLVRLLDNINSHGKKNKNKSKKNKNNNNHGKIINRENENPPTSVNVEKAFENDENQEGDNNIDIDNNETDRIYTNNQQPNNQNNNGGHKSYEL